MKRAMCAQAPDMLFRPVGFEGFASFSMGHGLASKDAFTCPPNRVGKAEGNRDS